MTEDISQQETQLAQQDPQLAQEIQAQELAAQEAIQQDPAAASQIQQQLDQTIIAEVAQVDPQLAQELQGQLDGGAQVTTAPASPQVLAQEQQLAAQDPQLAQEIHAQELAAQEAIQQDPAAASQIQQRLDQTIIADDRPGRPAARPATRRSRRAGGTDSPPEEQVQERDTGATITQEQEVGASQRPGHGRRAGAAGTGERVRLDAHRPAAVAAVGSRSGYRQPARPRRRGAGTQATTRTETCDEQRDRTRGSVRERRLGAAELHPRATAGALTQRRQRGAAARAAGPPARRGDRAAVRPGQSEAIQDPTQDGADRRAVLDRAGSGDRSRSTRAWRRS